MSDICSDRPVLGGASQDAPLSDEIEITPEMIEAGKAALCGYSLIDDDWGVIAFDVFSAMEGARRLRGSP